MIKKLLSIVVVFLLLITSGVYRTEAKEERLWQDEAIYTIMIDRFNNANFNNDYEIDMTDPLKYHGGDFQGIINKLDYLKELGFTVIQLSPIFANKADGFHGYWVENYQEIEEHFGTEEEFNELLNQAHERDIKVIVEFPVLEEEFTDEDILEAATYWVQHTSIDGYHIPYVQSKPLDFWQSFVQEVKSVSDHFHLSAGDANISHDEMEQYINIGFDSIHHTELNPLLREAFSSLDQSTNRLVDTMENVKDLFGKTEVFLDNIYTERFTQDMVANQVFPGTRWKLALAYLFTQPEVPVVNYASEIAIVGGHFPENIPLMNFRTDEELIDYLKIVGPLRQEQKALTRGTFELLYENEGMFVFKREYESDIIVVAINNTSQDQRVVIPATKLEDDKELRSLMTTDMARSSDGEYTLYLERETAEVYKLEELSTINIWFILSIFIVFGSFFLFMLIAWKRGKNRNPDPV